MQESFEAPCPFGGLNLRFISNVHFTKKMALNFMGERTIQSIPVMPFAMMLAVISAVIGLIVGIIYAVMFGAIFSAIPSTSTSGLNLGWLGVIFGVGAVIVSPIIGFIGGLIQGLIVAVLYNFLAPRIGGIRLRFKEESQVSPQS